MAKRKYITSGGLAFSEHKDMQKLEQQSSKGWHLEQFGFMGYKLKRGQPASMHYELDYRVRPDSDYFQLYQDAGWEHVCSAEETTHIFRAPPETKPLYTKEQDKQDVYLQQKQQLGRYAFVSLVFFLLLVTVLWILSSLLPSSSWFSIIDTVATMLALMPLIFTALPYFGYLFKVRQLQQKKEA
ncbi:DUF2812 domain-containing protein [uncultured Marinococcus sp.]|jgi:hypothetical protein|uniref:DUF2812 domain-containing protein n=1 Tax=uncultured Marinococcus sp. TaxID=487012 RepID=UPI00261BF8C3|nr:DUF2812 domain-containing protein [uncultured Marinococcus sp.]